MFSPGLLLCSAPISRMTTTSTATATGRWVGKKRLLNTTTPDRHTQALLNYKTQNKIAHDLIVKRNNTRPLFMKSREAKAKAKRQTRQLRNTMQPASKRSQRPQHSGLIRDSLIHGWHRKLPPLKSEIINLDLDLDVWASTDWESLNRLVLAAKFQSQSDHEPLLSRFACVGFFLPRKIADHSLDVDSSTGPAEWWMVVILAVSVEMRNAKHANEILICG